MWTRKYKPRPSRRLPLVHEQIVMQCARNLVRVAAALPQPQPRCPTGHIPIMVELRRTDDAEIYRYQVNVMPTGWPANDSLEGGRSDEHLPMVAHAGAIKATKRPPCPMHGLSVPDAATAIECWSPPSNTSSSSSISSSDSSFLAPMVFRQNSMHIFNGRNDSPVAENISTFCEPAVCAEASDPIRAHFMATLFQQQRSPLYYSEIWLQEGSNRPRLQLTPPATRQLMPPPENNSNNLGSIRRPRPINGLRQTGVATMKEDRKIAELCLDTNGEYVKNKLLQTPINGFAPFPITPAGLPKLPLNSINGFRGDIFGYGYVSEEHSGGAMNKNGFITGERSAAYSDQDKLMWLRSHNSQLGLEQKTGSYQTMVPLSVQGQGHIQNSTSMNFEGSGDFSEKSRLASETDLAATSTEPRAHYPIELQTLFRWNYCSLCRTSMRTVRNAVDHYSSRAHDRRVSSWLVRQCVAQSKIAGIGEGPNGGIGVELGMTSGIGAGGGCGSMSVPACEEDEVWRYLRTTNPADFYCDLCDLKLTSVMHAQQHFYGRRHRLVAKNQTKPNGGGYYDHEGRWVRTDAKGLMCELCDVSITSETQMALHMAGMRHRRMVYSHYPNGGGGTMIMGGMDLGNVYGGAGGRGAVSGGVTSFNGNHVYRVNANGTLAPLNSHEVPVFINQTPTSLPKTSVTPALKATTISVPNLCYLPPRPFNEQNTSYYCDACNVPLNHLKSVKQHEDGRLHQRNLHRRPGRTVFLN